MELQHEHFWKFQLVKALGAGPFIWKTVSDLYIKTFYRKSIYICDQENFYGETNRLVCVRNLNEFIERIYSRRLKFDHVLANINLNL